MVIVQNSMALIGFLLIVSAAICAPSCMGAAGDNVLYEGQTLRATQALVTGSYSLVMRANCNLVLYDHRTVLWSTGTAGNGRKCYLTLHKDGNLVLYTRTANKLWETNTRPTGFGNIGYILLLQKDGNAVIYGKAGNCIGSGSCLFGFQHLSLNSTEPTELMVRAWPEETNVLYPGETLKIGESLAWLTKRLTMENDCKLGMYESNKLAWRLDFHGFGYTGCYLECEVEGNFAIYDSKGTRVYGTSNTNFPRGNYIFHLWRTGMIGTFGPDRWSTNWDGLTRMPSEKISMVINE